MRCDKLFVSANTEVREHLLFVIEFSNYLAQAGDSGAVIETDYGTFRTIHAWFIFYCCLVSGPVCVERSEEADAVSSPQIHAITIQPAYARVDATRGQLALYVLMYRVLTCMN